MIKLRVSAEARRDLQEIGRAGIRDFGRTASAFRLLREHPFAGQKWPELALGVRSLSHRPHRILHRIEGHALTIERIIHQARDVGPKLSDQK